MQIIWWTNANNVNFYLKSHDIPANALTTAQDVQEAEENPISAITAIKNWLVNQMGIDEAKIHTGTKPPH